MGYPEPLRLLGLSEWLIGVTGSVILGEFLTLVLVMLCFFLPCFLVKVNNYVIIVLSFFILASLTAIGWLPFYTWVLMALFMAYSFSKMIKGVFA